MGLSRETLECLIEKGHTRKKMASELNVHVNTIYYWMLKHKLQTSPKKQCKKCGADDPDRFDPERHTICRSCRHKRSRVKKEKAVEYKGGKCSKCGYNRCIAALDFHHTNPQEKEYQWNVLRFKSWDKITQELDKCELLCKNCHHETHWEWSNNGHRS